MKKVAIIGGGYAGISAARELVKRDDIEVCLIDKHSYHNLQPEVYDLIAGKSDIADVTIDLVTLSMGLGKRVCFVNKRVTSIDRENKIIKTEEKEDIAYDYLIIAAGARTFFPHQIEGLEASNDLKKLHKALSFKQKFEKALFKKIDNEARKCEELNIVVVGGGLSGVEIAAEMAYYSQKFFKKGQFACEYMNIYLVSGTPTLLPGMSQFLIEKTHKRLSDLRVKILTNKLMTKEDSEFIYLSDDSRIRYDFMIFAGGIESANLSNRIEDLEKNKRGQFIVDSRCKATKDDSIYIAGDIAELKNPDGEFTPANVQNSVQSAKIAVANICAQIDNKEGVEYNFKNPGVLVALGGRYAAAEIGSKIKLGGFIGYALKHIVFLKYKLPLIWISKKGYLKLKVTNVKKVRSTQCK
eukprot:TRINITY_DN12398_c1_g5_i1.p2 TRINITY_DN12398_c1_g5~~TRINITY_DN12398_c1_g5_i1.p2  ORF type:complete len:411 (-),score=51.77 TRINITY_DN12398_c1_g5_i1:2547-3779(-)